MFVRREIDVLAVNETKVKGTGVCVFGSVNGRVSGVLNGRAREGVGLLLSERVNKCVRQWKKVSSRLMWVKIEWALKC
jgi:hypothetical protein